MKDRRGNFLTNPTKKHLVVFGLLWLIGIMLLTLSMTDLLTESFFQKKYVVMYLYMMGSSMTTGYIYYNYWKNNHLKARL